MIWLIVAGIGLVVLLSQSKGATVGGDEVEYIPPTVTTMLPGDWNDPDSIMEAAFRAEQAGYRETAKALATKAQDTSDVKKAVERAVNNPLPSPIPRVGAAPWTAFVNLYQGGKVDEVSPTMSLGLYGVGYLRLRDLDMAVDVKQVNRNGKMVWEGRFKSPLTLHLFLASPRIQYEVFARDMKERADFIRSEFPKLIGATLPDLGGLTTVTLSGLLGVIKLSGTKGFSGWVADPKQRAKFANTTAAFKAANGLF